MTKTFIYKLSLATISEYVPKRMHATIYLLTFLLVYMKQNNLFLINIIK